MQCVPKYMETMCSEMDNCNIQPRVRWLTFLRDPVSRFISEWQMVIRAGGGWGPEDATCGNFQPQLGYMERCRWDTVPKKVKRTGVATKNLTFEEFLSCPANLGYNRQTRMLADFSLLNCHNLTARNYKDMQRKMLQSAKDNLAKLDFFGLTEYQTKTQILFEKTFHVKFDVEFMNAHTIASSKYQDVTEEQLDKTRMHNQLDIQLYEFAQQLFLTRTRKFNISAKEKR